MIELESIKQIKSPSLENVIIFALRCANYMIINDKLNGLYQLIEVKGDNKIDDIVVKAKATAAHEMAVASGIEYKMYAGSDIMNTRILDYLDNTRKVVNYEALIQEEIPTMVAEDLAPYGTKK